MIKLSVFSFVCLVTFPIFAQSDADLLLRRDQKALVEWNQANKNKILVTLMQATKDKDKDKSQVAKNNLKDYKNGKRLFYPELDISRSYAKIGNFYQAVIKEKTEGGYVAIRYYVVWTSQGERPYKDIRSSTVILLTDEKFLPDEEIQGLWHYQGTRDGWQVFERYVPD